MTDKKTKCEKLCSDCRYMNYSFEDEEFVHYCTAHKKTVDSSCVTGSLITLPALCINHNKNGQCKKFKALSYIRLRNLLIEYLDDNECDWACRSTIKRTLAENLLMCIRDEKSKLLEEIFTGDSPYDHTIIVTKDAIEKSLEARECKLDESKDPINGGCYVDKKPEIEIKREQSWINRVKKAMRDD